MILCNNCGAEFEDTQASCPYCGYIYEPGAEKEYMEDMEEIREDMSQLSDMSQQVYKKELSATVKRTGKIFLVIALVIGVLLGIFMGLHILLDVPESEEEIKARMAWERENFPKLDAWYEEGNYEAILDFSREESQEEDYSFYTWDHCMFIFSYEEYKICMEVRDMLRNGAEITKYNIQDGVASSMNILFFMEEADYTEEEWGQVQLWQEEVEAFLYGELQFTEEEALELKEKADKDGFLSYKICYDYADSIMGRYIQ